MIAIFKVATIIVNIVWISVEIRHFHKSNLEVFDTIQTGKTRFAIDNLQNLLGNMGAYNKCMDSTSVNKSGLYTSNTKEFVYLFGGISMDGIDQLKKLDQISQCLHNPYALIAAIEQATWNGLDLSQQERPDDTQGDHEYYPTLNNKLNLNASAFVPEQYNTIYTQNGDKFDIQKFTKGAELITYEFRQQKSYVNGMHYLENLIDPYNEDLARKLLNDQDFKIYTEEMEKHQPTDTNSIPIVNIQHAPTYLEKAKVIAGTVYELFWKKPSHSHIMDIINQARDTIMNYSRTMRQQYHLYNDLFQDICKEFDRVSLKTSVAWNRAKWIFVNAGVLGAQIGELVAHDIVPLLLKRGGSQLAIESGKSIVQMVL